MKKEWRKEEKHLYLPKTEPMLIDIPKMNYFIVEGKGNPNSSPGFQEAIEILYSLSYTIKMAPKNGMKIDDYFDYTVYPLEGVWDFEEETRGSETLDKDHLVYSLMIRQPDFVDLKLAEIAIDRARRKKTNLNYDRVRFDTITEGNCVQMMHIGSFDEEPKSFEKMKNFCIDNDLERLSLIHREIYLSDFRKTKPEALKTVLRFQVKKNK